MSDVLLFLYDLSHLIEEAVLHVQTAPLKFLKIGLSIPLAPLATLYGYNGPPDLQVVPLSFEHAPILLQI